MTDYRFAMIYLELKIAVLKHRFIFKVNLPLSLAHFVSQHVFTDLLLDPNNIRRCKKYVDALVVSLRLQNIAQLGCHHPQLGWEPKSEIVLLKQIQCLFRQLSRKRIPDLSNCSKAPM